MFKFCKLILILSFPAVVFAQDPAVVKQQANIMAKALAGNDYKTLVAHMYPKLVQSMGGKEKMTEQATKGMAMLKGQGVIFESATVGTVGKFYKAGKEIHCLVPDEIVFKTPNGHVRSKGNLLAVSGDKGKTWSFLDLNQATISKMNELFPTFNKDLKIPDPQQLQMTM